MAPDLPRRLPRKLVREVGRLVPPRAPELHGPDELELCIGDDEPPVESGGPAGVAVATAELVEHGEAGDPGAIAADGGHGQGVSHPPAPALPLRLARPQHQGPQQLLGGSLHGALSEHRLALELPAADPDGVAFDRVSAVIGDGADLDDERDGQGRVSRPCPPECAVGRPGAASGPCPSRSPAPSPWT